MIVRKHLRLDKSIRYSWEVLLFSTLISSAVWYLQDKVALNWLAFPETVIGVLGTALAIFWGFLTHRLMSVGGTREPHGVESLMKVELSHARQ